MRQFSRYCREKLGETSFRELFERECHVCRFTVQIFEKMTERKATVEELANLVQTDPEKVRLLMDADYCDPSLVIRLCRHLGLSEPSACPRMDSP